MKATIFTGGVREQRKRFDRVRTHTYTFHSRASQLLSPEDREIGRNSDFSYQLIKPDEGRQAGKLTLLLHGFNEKSWDKYRAWGETICRETGSAVIFFPIAFHMQRAPERWSDRREMYRLSEARRKFYPGIQCSSLSNAAMSARMQEDPARLVRGGLQSYYDVIQLLQECREGRLDQVRKECSVDLFGYSIGGLLAELLKLSNPDGMFSRSRVCLFCSGPVFSKMRPVSRYILDSEAHRVLQEYLLDSPEACLQEVDLNVKRTFLSMLDYGLLSESREEMFRKNAAEIYAIVLKKDLVVPSSEVHRTLLGEKGDYGIRLDEMDFSYPYTHENPFVSRSVGKEDGDIALSVIMKKVCQFLK